MIPMEPATTDDFDAPEVPFDPALGADDWALLEEAEAMDATEDAADRMLEAEEEIALETEEAVAETWEEIPPEVAEDAPTKEVVPA